MLGMVTSWNRYRPFQDPQLADVTVEPTGLPATPDGVQTALKINVPLVPPKPKEFDITTRIFIDRAVFGT